MYKWVVAFLASVLCTSFLATSRAAFDGVSLGDYPSDSILSQTIKGEQSLPLLDQIVELPTQHFDQIEAAAIITRINSLPPSLLKKINNHGINLKLFTGKLTDNPTARQLAGETPRGYQSNTTWDEVPGSGGSKVVLVKIGFSEKGKGHGSINLELHEMAHSIDRYVYGEISGSPEFQSIWEREHERLFPGNSYFLYPEEYFAESFAMYYLNADSKEQLRVKAPNTFKFIQKLH